MKTVNSPFKFKGGVHPDYNKELARAEQIERLPLPAELVISMSQHLGAPAKCLVKAGDFVKKGQLIGEKNGFISVCVRASADGKVKAVEKRPGPTGGLADAVILDTTVPPPEGTGPAPVVLPPLDWRTATREELLKRVEEAGICGMGGAGFPSAVKLNPPPGKRCEIINICNKLYFLKKIFIKLTYLFNRKNESSLYMVTVRNLAFYKSRKSMPR